MCRLVILFLISDFELFVSGQAHKILVSLAYYCTPVVVQDMVEICLGDDENSENRICLFCSRQVPLHDSICPHCGNVFRKEDKGLGIEAHSEEG